MGLYLGRRVIGRIFASELWGEGGRGGGLLSEFYGILKCRKYDHSIEKSLAVTFLWCCIFPPFSDTKFTILLSKVDFWRSNDVTMITGDQIGLASSNKEIYVCNRSIDGRQIKNYCYRRKKSRRFSKMGECRFLSRVEGNNNNNNNKIFI